MGPTVHDRLEAARDSHVREAGSRGRVCSTGDAAESVSHHQARECQSVSQALLWLGI